MSPARLRRLRRMGLGEIVGVAPGRGCEVAGEGERVERVLDEALGDREAGDEVLHAPEPVIDAGVRVKKPAGAARSR